MDDERMSKPEVEEEETYEKMTEFIMLGSEFFKYVDVMVNEKEGEDAPVAGILFTNHRSLIKAVSYLDIPTVLEDEPEEKEKEDAEEPGQTEAHKTVHPGEMPEMS